jgi:hypothetical protein
MVGSSAGHDEVVILERGASVWSSNIVRSEAWSQC